jgi:hypothetical protein
MTAPPTPQEAEIAGVAGPFVLWLLGRCWHKWGPWEAPERVTIGRMGRTVLPSGTVILHGERDISVKWRQCRCCGKWKSRQVREAHLQRAQGER